MSKSGEIKHWVVGVDKDQYEEGIFKGKDKDGKRNYPLQDPIPRKKNIEEL